MSARTELAGILAQWQQLSRDEGRAIDAAAWPRLRKIQARKAVLRQPLTQAFQRCAKEEGRADFPFQSELARIISLLTRNGERLAARCRQARARQEALERSRRNLRRIERSYSHLGRRANGHSYS